MLRDAALALGLALLVVCSSAVAGAQTRQECNAQLSPPPSCCALCDPQSASLPAFCTRPPCRHDVEPSAFPMLRFQLGFEAAVHSEASTDLTLAAMPTFGIRVSDAFSVIARGRAGLGARAGAPDFVLEGGGGLGLDFVFFGTSTLGAIRALDFNVTVGPWVASQGDRVFAWTPLFVSAQFGLLTTLAPNATQRPYSTLLPPTFGLEVGAGYDFDVQRWVGRVGFYVAIDAAFR